jgi:hypothetical protein
VPLEGKFLPIALVNVRITLNVIVRQMPLNNGVSIVQKLVVKLSNTSLFPPVAKNVVEVFESLTTSILMMDTPLFSGHLGAFDALSHLILSLQ